MTITLAEFNEKNLNAAKNKWMQDAVILDMPISEIDKVFNYASTHIDYKNTKNDSLSYAIFCEQTNDCLAVVDVVVSNNNPQKSLIKMLTVDLCPDLIHGLINDDMVKIDKVIDVYLSATLGTIGLTSHHKADMIKLYGRSHAMRLLLKSIESGINANQSLNLKTKWEGIWLTITSA